MSMPPAGVSKKSWNKLSPMAQIIVEAGMCFDAKELPETLVIEDVIAGIDLKDMRHPGWRNPRGDIVRMELKQFLQFLQRFTAISAYCKRVTTTAEENGMRLSLVEDGASLYLNSLTHKERMEAYKIPNVPRPPPGTPFTEAEQAAVLDMCHPRHFSKEDTRDEGL
jgi:hypothetical protein